MATSISPIDVAGAYLRERYASPVFLVLAGILTLTSLGVSRGIADPAAVVRALVSALLLVLAFRIADDLADAARDRDEHPNRVMVRSMSRSPFLALLMVSAVAVVAILASGTQPLLRVLLVLSTAAVLGAWYAMRGNSGALINAHAVLAKYPIIALAIAPALPRSLTPSVLALLAGLYAALCAYETFDDPSLRSLHGARRLAWFESAFALLLLSGGIFA